ncbi:hypothetical protein FRC08_012407 [Ceratobasidium sp. 394]|nr:hypothetical protein FRC08_012407 [Ceratobasidium sp. 394]KAG9079186.1 hypothetical protein FS749_008751 [Ceratobasidium sp. UAMH 11750]
MTRNGPMFVALPPGPAFVGTPILGGPESWMTVINLEPMGGDKYAMRLWYHSGLNAGFNEDNTEPGARVIVTGNPEQAWAIDQGDGEDSYRIHVPDQNLYWSVPSGARDPIAITMLPLQGMPTQEWNFGLLRG